ncbi:hypothetical protein [Pseudomonas sp.]|uniref:DUF7173 family protein n=1 Tax=Pseudomonas sp. TaxID=306 RepID=UPI00258C812C|nr:hypothetical protein [Pseudomonas sp.]
MNIIDLTQQLIAAKAAEAKANKERVAIEGQIIELLGQREEGAQTTELDNGLKVTITGKNSYKADMPALMQICSNLPENLRPIKTETKLDESGAKYLRANEPEIWAMLASAITVKPAKPSVEVKA